MRVIVPAVSQIWFSECAPAGGVEGFPGQPPNISNRPKHLLFVYTLPLIIASTTTILLPIV